MKIKPFDVLAILVSLSVIAIFSWTVYAQPARQLQVVISSPSREWIYPLGTDREIPVAGPIGVSHVHIHGMAAWIAQSPCKNQVCVEAGQITEAGQMIACLPNQVMVIIRGTGDPEELNARLR
jgi:hypothetical protein